MRLSVALCTYNGGRFLAEQLDSIGRQTRPPDELVVCDDASSDGSATIVRAFAGRAPFPVRLEVNESNLRSTRNFAKAIGLCAGDLIALADQDDVWLPHKLSTLEAAMAAAPDAGFAFSDADMVDERLAPLGYSLWEAVRFGRREQARFRNGGAFEALLRRYRVTGATMAFRSSFRGLVLPIPPAWVHDAWIALLLASVAPCAAVAERLIRYRQHARQQLGEKRRGLYGQFLVARTMDRGVYAAVADRYDEAAARLRTAAGEIPGRVARVEEKAAHYRERAGMRDRGGWRLPAVAREAWRGRYGRYSLGWKAVAQDLFLG